jgi:hypothetical protein
MAQPSFVPITEADQVRPTAAQPTPTWLAGRPSEQRQPTITRGKGFGSTGPDGGFAIKLAADYADRLVLAPGEDKHDVEIGAALIASKRAARLGRAPSVYDVQVALGLFGYLAEAPSDLIEYRRGLFQAVGHSWEAQGALVDAVPDEALSLTPDEAAEAPSAWRAILGV